MALRRRTRQTPDQPAAATSFGAWENLSSRTLAVCHPEWRGVRTAAHAFGDAVVETTDTWRDADLITRNASHAGVETLILHGFPPRSEALLISARKRGLATRVVMHSSMAQHGAEAGEAEMMDAVVRLAEAGVIGRIGVVKAGLAETFEALGIPATHTPNRTPDVSGVHPVPLDGTAPHVGVFGALFWRKNVVTQLGAVAVLGGTAHVLERPAIEYLARLPLVEHGELPRAEFLTIQASTHLNLYVTLSECHPLGPIESYLLGVPALMSRTSGVFRSDGRLWELTTVEEADDPVAIAAAARRLLTRAPEAVERARAWIARTDEAAAATWRDFTDPA